MRTSQDRKLIPIVATTVAELKKEVFRGTLYIIPDGPLRPLVTTVILFIIIGR